MDVNLPFELVFDDDGAPLCPWCDGMLVFVARTVAAAEYRILAVEVDGSDADAPLLMPIVADQAEYVDTVETLEQRVECDNLDCEFVLEPELLGDVDYASPDDYR